MAEPLRIFVSATHDLEAERAVIGRALARLPVQLGVEIRRTPAAGASIETMHELVANVDRFYFLMGQDITAPAGAEWHLAVQLERSIFALRHRTPQGVPTTPAAEQFLRGIPIEWHWFLSSARLARLVTLDVARLLHHPANRYGLTLLELETLPRYIEQLQQSILHVDDEPGGAQGGGVLLDDGRREPLLGVPLDEA